MGGGGGVVRSLDLSAHTSLSPIRRGFAPSFIIYKKGCTRLAAASDKVYQLLAQDRWFSPGTPASPATKTGCHDIAEILLKVALKHQKSIKSFCDVSVNIHSCVFRVQSISCQGHSFSFTFNVKLYLYDNVLKYIYVYKARNF